MPLIGFSDRPALSQLKAQMAGCRQRVPARCQGFERTLLEVEREIELAFRRWWPLRPREDELARLRKRTLELAADSEAFAAFAAALAPLEEKVRWLRQEALRTPDPEVQNWLIRHCDGWVGALSRLGQAQRSAELAAEQKRLLAVEAEVRLAEEAITVLAELARAAAALPGEVGVAPLAAQLLGLRQEVLHAQVTAELLRKARRFLAPLANLQPSSPVQGQAEDLVVLVTVLQSWSGATGLLVSKVEALVAQMLNHQEQPDELAAQGRELLEQLLAFARSRREASLRDLEQKNQALANGCGRQPEQKSLEASLEALAKKNIAEPTDHQAWESDLEQLRRRFADLAKVLEEDLRAVLRARLDAATEVLQRLEKEPDLPAAVAIECDRLSGSLQSLIERRGWREVLPGLAETEELQETLLALEAGVISERAVARSLDERRPALIDELQALSAAQLRPQERAERDLCLRELDELGPASATDLRQRRLRVEPVVTQGEDLLERLRQAERRVRARHADLMRRLEAFHRADYGLEASPLRDRVEGLIYGVPAAPQAWNAVEDQLTLAEQLLARLDRHGRRRAAAQVAGLLDALDRSRTVRLEPGLRHEIDDLVAKALQLGSHILPPSSWRRRAEQLLRRAGTPAIQGVAR